MRVSTFSNYKRTLTKYFVHFQQIDRFLCLCAGHACSAKFRQSCRVWGLEAYEHPNVASSPHFREKLLVSNDVIAPSLYEPRQIITYLFVTKLIAQFIDSVAQAEIVIGQPDEFAAILLVKVFEFVGNPFG